MAKKSYEEGGILGAIKKKVNKIKNTIELSNRTSDNYPDDTLPEHYDRIKKVRSAESLADMENSMSDKPVEPTPKKPKKRKTPIVRDKLLPRSKEKGNNFKGIF